MIIKHEQKYIKRFDVRAVSNSFTMFLKHDIILFHFKQAMETKIFLPFPMYMTLWVLAHGYYYLGNMSAIHKSVDSRYISQKTMNVVMFMIVGWDDANDDTINDIVDDPVL